MSEAPKIDELFEFVEKISLELYPKEEWDRLNAEQERRTIAPFELNIMREEVYEECFKQKPELFEGVQWINSDEGMPLWVREGVEWIPEHELDD